MAEWSFSPEVIRKAERYLEEERVMADPDVPNVIWVQGSTARLYRVQHDATPDRRRVRWIACTCTHGMNNAGVARCSHAVAALLALRDDLALPSKHEQTSGHPRA